MEQNVAPRGRPRGFDVDAKLARVREVFWQKGYSATSLDEIVRATNIHKPSLQAAYGDKRAMYLRALEQYARQGGEALRAALSEPRLADALNAFFAGAIDTFAPSDSASLGCFLIGTAVPLAREDKDVGMLVNRAHDGLRSALLRRLRDGAANGELRACLTAELATALILSTHLGLAVRARSGSTRRDLMTTACDLVKHICV